MEIAELRIRLLVAGLNTRYGDAIESQAQPCLRFDTIAMDENELWLGCSKLGGSPDLPIGMTWPSHGDRLLDCLGQNDLLDFSQYPLCKILPPKGLLAFFLDFSGQAEGYNPADQKNWRVIFHSGPREGLERRVRPEIGKTPAPFKPCRIVFHQASSPGWAEIPIDALHLNEEQEDKYRHFIDCLPDEKAHQVLGGPGLIEDLGYGMQLECQFRSNGILMGEDGRPVDEARAKEVEPGAADWRLLLQLDSDEEAGMDWGDSMISFWIRKRDLQNRNFSEVWMIEEWF